MGLDSNQIKCEFAHYVISGVIIQREEKSEGGFGEYVIGICTWYIRCSEMGKAMAGSSGKVEGGAVEGMAKWLNGSLSRITPQIQFQSSGISTLEIYSLYFTIIRKVWLIRWCLYRFYLISYKLASILYCLL